MNAVEKSYKGYMMYSKKEVNNIWENGVIVLDTNILLDFFRLSNDSRKKFFSLLSIYKDRLWIPDFVVVEYFKNRDVVINDSKKMFSSFYEEIKNYCSAIDKSFFKYKEKVMKHEELEIIFNDFRNKFNAKIEEFIKQDADNFDKEKLFKIEKEIFDLIGDNVGNKISDTEFNTLVDEGDYRMNNNIPPGYKDKNKEKMIHNGKIINGDYIIYYSLMNYSKENKKDIIFITNDQKEDWYLYVKGEKKGGRPELLNEFHINTGKLLILYSLENFLNMHNDKTNISDQKISPEVINEISNLNSFKIKRKRELSKYFDDFYSNLGMINKLLKECDNSSKSLNEIKYEIACIMERITGILKKLSSGMYLKYSTFDKYLDFILNIMQEVSNSDSFEDLKLISNKIDSFVRFNKLYNFEKELVHI